MVSTKQNSEVSVHHPLATCIPRCPNNLNQHPRFVHSRPQSGLKPAINPHLPLSCCKSSSQELGDDPMTPSLLPCPFIADTRFLCTMAACTTGMWPDLSCGTPSGLCCCHPWSGLSRWVLEDHSEHGHTSAFWVSNVPHCCSA